MPYLQWSKASCALRELSKRPGSWIIDYIIWSKTQQDERGWIGKSSRYYSTKGYQKRGIISWKGKLKANHGPVYGVTTECTEQLHPCLSMYVRKCAETKYPTTLVKSIMQYSNLNLAIPSTKWGCDNEDHAREEYRVSMDPRHECFSLQSAGLLVSTKFPFLNVSLDGVFSC